MIFQAIIEWADAFGSRYNGINVYFRRKTVNQFTLPSGLKSKDDVKAAYLELITLEIKWQQYGATYIGFVNSTAIFQISFNDNLEIVIETWYPGQEREFCHGVDTIDSAKKLAEKFYQNWLKKDFRKLLD